MKSISKVRFETERICYLVRYRHLYRFELIAVKSVLIMMFAKINHEYLLEK